MQKMCSVIFDGNLDNFKIICSGFDGLNKYFINFCGWGIAGYFALLFVRREAILAIAVCYFLCFRFL